MSPLGPRATPPDLVAPRSLRRPAAVLAAFCELTKPRIASFVLLAAAVGAALVSGEAGLLRVAGAALAIGCVAAASCVFNQVLEREVDGLMHRTRSRPLVTGRVELWEAIAFATVLAGGGVAVLAVSYNLASALLALATLATYALVYTPLKQATSLNTIVGALPGAMPPLLGAVALAGAPTAWGWILFALVFAWQFPHFLAIAWIYREDYARAGMPMLPAIPGNEGAAGRQALNYAAILLPLSLLPGLRGQAGILFTATALVLGLLYTLAAAAFARRECESTARRLLLVSLVYLPVVLGAALLDASVHDVLRG